MKLFKNLLLIILTFGLFFNGVDPTGTITDSAFKSGEDLKYVLHYGWINGGIASMKIVEREKDGKIFFHARIFAKTIGMTDKIFNVKDIYESYIDPETYLPIKSIRNITEGNYKSYNEVDYNFEENVAISTKSGEHKIPDNIHDIVSAFYFARNVMFNELKLNEKFTIQTFFDDEIYPLEIRYKGIDVIDTKFGEISCLKFTPIVEPGRVFNNPEGDVVVWISNDKNHIPVRAEMKLLVGAVKCDLLEYSGLKNKLNIVED